MTSTTRPTRDVLEMLQSLPAPQRPAFLYAQSGNVEDLLIRLGDEAEQMIVVEVARALSTADILVALSDECGVASARSRARRARGQALAYAGRHDESLVVCREAARIADESGEIVQAARARIASMHPLGELGRYDEAIDAGNTARAMLVDAGEPSLAARADINLGVIHRKCGRAADALAHLDRAREALADAPLIVAQLDSNRGEALLELDRLDEAENAFADALRAFESSGNRWGAAIVEGNLADLAARQGRPDRALYHFESARRHVESDQSPTHLARLLLETADVKMMIGMLPESVEDYREALEILQPSDQRADVARGLAGLGHALMRMGGRDEARGRLEAAQRIWRELGNDIAAARVRMLRAEAAFVDGEYDTARMLLEESIDALPANSLDRACAQYRLARVAIECGEYDAAASAVEAALEAARRFGVEPLVADLLLLRGRCFSAVPGADAAREAIDAFRGSVERLERIRGTLQAERFRASFLGERLASYELLASALLDGGRSDDVAEAFSTIQRARSRSLIDALNGAVGLGVDEAEAEHGDPESQPLASDVSLRLSAARARLNVLYSRVGGGERGIRSVESAWREEADQLEREIASLEGRLAARRGLSQLLAEPASLDRVRAALDEGSGLIEYFTEGAHLSAFVIRPDDVRIVRRLASREAVADVVRRFHFQVGRTARPGALDGARAARLEADARVVCEQAHAMVFAPLERDLGGASRVIVAPTGPLHALPFAALHTGSGYLIERLEVAHVPSAGVYAHLAEAAAQRTSAHDRQTGAAVVVGVADANAPSIDREIRAIESVIGEATALCGDAATVNDVMAALCTAPIAHLACHGRFDGRNPMASGLRLADRWLTVRDIYRLRLPESFITLSGCETGVSEIGTGDELIGVVRAFIAAGAVSLAVSLWKVNDEVTMKLMQSFYRSTFGRDSEHSAADFTRGAASAMRAAQIETLRSHPHPALWAAFILVGRP